MVYMSSNELRKLLFGKKEIEMEREYYLMINGKKMELTEEQLKQLGIENKEESKRWRAERGQPYSYVNAYGVVHGTPDYRSSEDDFRYYSHNYLETAREAEVYERVLETEMLLQKYADEHNEPMFWDGECKRWHLWLNINFNKINYKEVWISKYPRFIYFSSYELAEDAVKEVSEDRVMEYLKYEW